MNLLSRIYVRSVRYFNNFLVSGYLCRRSPILNIIHARNLCLDEYNQLYSTPVRAIFGKILLLILMFLFVVAIIAIK